MTVKCIIFDLGGVLYKNGTLYPIAEHLSGIYNKQYEKIHAIIKENWIKARINEISCDVFWNNISSFLSSDKDELKQIWFDFEKMDNKDITNQDVLEIAKKLKEDYTTAIISNHIEDWFNYLRKEYRLDEIFEKIITSFDTGFAKPQKEIFLKALDILKIKPDDCIFIDDKEKNTKTAQDIGFKTILFSNDIDLRNEIQKHITQ